MRIAQIKAGKVINVIVGDASIIDGVNYIASDTAGIDDSHVNGVFVKPTQIVDLNQAKSDQIATLINDYKTAIQLPVAYISTTFQADDYSQNLLTKSLAPGSVPNGFFWLDANNAKVQMTFAQLQGLALAMLNQGQTAFAKLQTLKDQVRAASTDTVEKVRLIIW